jgi:hypothetical protein
MAVPIKCPFYAGQEINVERHRGGREIGNIVECYSMGNVWKSKKPLTCDIMWKNGEIENLPWNVIIPESHARGIKSKKHRKYKKYRKSKKHRKSKKQRKY